MTGDNSIKYEDRYIVDNINFTDNSKNLIANMKADKGIYKEEDIFLDGDIIYVREDGLTFKTDKATYNKKEELIKTDSKFISYRGENTLNGSTLKYYNNTQKTEATNVTIKYQLKERL